MAKLFWSWCNGKRDWTLSIWTSNDKTAEFLLVQKEQEHNYAVNGMNNITRAKRCCHLENNKTTQWKTKSIFKWDFVCVTFQAPRTSITLQRCTVTTRERNPILTWSELFNKHENVPSDIVHQYCNATHKI